MGEGENFSASKSIRSVSHKLHTLHDVRLEAGDLALWWEAMEGVVFISSPAFSGVEWVPKLSVEGGD
jgi:hypothetical protein